MEQLHHTLHIAAFGGAGEQFPVGERACPTLAKAVVALGCKALVAVQQSYVALALTDGFTALVDNRTYAVLQERQRGKQPRRTHADDVHFGRVRRGDVLINGLFVRRKKRLLGTRTHIYREQNLGLTLARVNRPFHDMPSMQKRRRQGHFKCHCLLYLGCICRLLRSECQNNSFHLLS